MSFSAVDVDVQMAKQLLTVTQPAAIEAARQAWADAAGVRDQAIEAIELELQQAHYQARRAERQFDAVDPDNRTVASDAADPKDRAKNARKNDRRLGRPVVVPIRYADDFLLLISVPPGPAQHERGREEAEKEKAAIGALLKEKLGLELSETKTFITPVTTPFAFLGHHVVVRLSHSFRRLACITLIPKERGHRTRERIKRLCGRNRVRQSLHDLLRELNWILRGWSNFYRHAWGAKRIFSSLDYYAWWTVFRWLRKKHQGASVKTLKILYQSKGRGIRRGQWHHRGVTLFISAKTRVGRYRRTSARQPHFAIHHGEPGA